MDYSDNNYILTITKRLKRFIFSHIIVKLHYKQINILDMKKTYEEIENEILKIRKDLIEIIKEALIAKYYGVNDTVPGIYVSVKVDKDWDHIVACDNRQDRDTFYHVDHCSVDTLLEAYKTIINARPKF